MRFAIRDLFLVTMIVALAVASCTGGCVHYTPRFRGVSHKTLVGRWQSSSPTDDIEVQFTDDGTCNVFTASGQVVQTYSFTIHDEYTTIALRSRSPGDNSYFSLVVQEGKDLDDLTLSSPSSSEASAAVATNGNLKDFHFKNSLRLRRIQQSGSSRDP